MADLLRTDYKDDVLNTEVNTQRKYQMITNDDGTVSFIDVTDYAQVGDGFGGAVVNAQNEALANNRKEISELNNALVPTIVGSASSYVIVRIGKLRILEFTSANVSTLNGYTLNDLDTPNRTHIGTLYWYNSDSGNHGILVVEVTADKRMKFRDKSGWVSGSAVTVTGQIVYCIE